MSPMNNERFGLAAERPLVAELRDKGTIWYSTDTDEVWTSDGVDWTQLGGAGGGPALAGNNVWTGTNEFQDTVTILDSSIEIRQTGAPQPLAAIDTNGIFYLGNGAVVPVPIFNYDAFFGGIQFTAIARFSAATRFEGVNTYTPTSHLVWAEQTNPLHTMITTDLVGAGPPLFRMDVSGLSEWGDGVAASDTNLYRSGVAELRTDTAFTVGTDLAVEGNTALGNAITDLIGLYGTAAVAQAAAIAAPTAPGAVYSQAEAQSMEAAVNFLIAAVAGIGITA